MGRIIACKSSELEAGKMKKVSVDSKEILVANVNGNYFACDDTCTHAGASLSRKFRKFNSHMRMACSTIYCETGKMEKFPAKINDLKSYTVVVESEDVFIEI